MAEGNKYTTECKGPQIEFLNKEVELPLSALGLKNGMDPESSLFLAQEKNYKSFVTAQDNSIMIVGLWQSWPSSEQYIIFTQLPKVRSYKTYTVKWHNISLRPFLVQNELCVICCGCLSVTYPVCKGLKSEGDCAHHSTFHIKVAMLGKFANIKMHHSINLNLIDL